MRWDCTSSSFLGMAELLILNRIWLRLACSCVMLKHWKCCKRHVYTYVLVYWKHQTFEQGVFWGLDRFSNIACDMWMIQYEVLDTCHFQDLISSRLLSGCTITDFVGRLFLCLSHSFHARWCLLPRFSRDQTSTNLIWDVRFGEIGRMRRPIPNRTADNFVWFEFGRLRRPI